MRVDDFDFHLPEERIALYPADPRDSARLLVVPKTGAFLDRTMRDLTQEVRANDILVFNDTRVLPVQLSATRRRGEGVVAIGATLVRRDAPNAWSAFLKPGRRAAIGDRLDFGGPDALHAFVEARGDEGLFSLRFSAEGPVLDAALRHVGALPLPPYIAQRRPFEDEDRTRYQTVYARADGSVAAPTAGLHFTPDLLAQLDAAGVRTTRITLHVGMGTFLPVKVEDTADHIMHAEWGEVSEQAVADIEAARAAGGRVIAVGTTALRLLETAARDGALKPWVGETAIFITPGFSFRCADGLMTNFHLPRSTLMMLVSAFAGMERMRAAYAHAIEAGYRFYSYGDGSLLWRQV